MSRRSPIHEAAHSTRRAKDRFDRFVMRLAAVGGWIGVAALGLLVPFWLSDDGMPREKLVAWTVGALMLASLVGWRYVNEGQNALARKIGALPAMLLFFWLPLACGAASLFQARLEDATGFAAPGHPFWLFVTWFPPLTVMVCAAVFLKRQALPRSRVHFWRGLGSILLLIPYALLFAYLVLHLRIVALEDPLHETLGDIGRYSIIVQLLLMYFVGGAAS